MSLDSFPLSNTELIKAEGSGPTDSSEHNPFSAFSSASVEEGKQQLKAVVQLGGGSVSGGGLFNLKQSSSHMRRCSAKVWPTLFRF